MPVIYIFTFINVELFFLSIPIPDFMSSDRFAWTGPLRFPFTDRVASVGRLALSFTDRRNSSLRSSNTTGRAFGKPNRTLVHCSNGLQT